MRVWLKEKNKTSIPAMVEAVSIRYSKSRSSLVIDCLFKWHEIDMSVEEAQELMDNCADEGKQVLDLRNYGAIGFHRRDDR